MTIIKDSSKNNKYYSYQKYDEHLLEDSDHDHCTQCTDLIFNIKKFMKKCKECGKRNVCKDCYKKGLTLCKTCDDEYIKQMEEMAGLQ